MNQLTAAVQKQPPNRSLLQKTYDLHVIQTQKSYHFNVIEYQQLPVSGLSKMNEAENEKKIVGFHQMNLDDRLLKAIAKLGWVTPTLIQERGIPLFLDGKDVLAKGRTGSGKTAVFAIPIIQNILSIKQTTKEQVTRALVLAPSKELCQQLFKVFQSLTVSCSRDVSCVNVASQVFQL